MPSAACAVGAARETNEAMIRIMTYNVHGCVGCDGRLEHTRARQKSMPHSSTGSQRTPSTTT
jgi:hypothetical protein